MIKTKILFAASVAILMGATNIISSENEKILVAIESLQKEVADLRSDIHKTNENLGKSIGLAVDIMQKNVGNLEKKLIKAGIRVDPESNQIINVNKTELGRQEVEPILDKVAEGKLVEFANQHKD
ncbi:MAG: hypothetical protein IJ481_00860 [Alphaproteobacteria bacterium]|nr:hypothetical protein [Alphaproteobacteria bacterium]